MKAVTNIATSDETGALIDHILSRYHEVHRAELANLQLLAEKIEAVHGGDLQLPKGLSQAIKNLWGELEDHMAKEEVILCPVMRAGGTPGLEHPIAIMRGDHNNHAESIALILRITANLVPPDHACGSWRALYAGTAKFLDDLASHIALENEMLFPRFEQK